MLFLFFFLFFRTEVEKVQITALQTLVKLKMRAVDIVGKNSWVQLMINALLRKLQKFQVFYALHSSDKVSAIKHI
jgi:hypothetical protein